MNEACQEGAEAEHARKLLFHFGQLLLRVDAEEASSFGDGAGPEFLLADGQKTDAHSTSDGARDSADASGKCVQSRQGAQKFQVAAVSNPVAKVRARLELAEKGAWGQVVHELLERHQAGRAAEDVVADLGLDVDHQLVEELEGLGLVLDQRIPLGVGPQPDRAAQGVPAVQVLLPEAVDLVVIDVSFISLRLVLPAVALLAKPGAPVVALVKPQFEVGRADVGKGGIVRDDAARARALPDVAAVATALGYTVAGETTSPITGGKGNIEFLLSLRCPLTRAPA
jgi:hypothetical protein